MAGTLTQRITPIWLRPAAVAAVILVHGGAVIGVPWPSAEEPAVTAPLSIQVVPQGRLAPAIEAPRQAQVAEVNATEARAMDAQAAATKATIAPTERKNAREQDRPAEVRGLPPQRVVAAVEPAAQVVTAVEVPQPRIDEKKDGKKAVIKKKHKRHEKEDATEASQARAVSRASALSQDSSASAVTGGAASANYRSIVAAELNRRKFYPPGARASGIEGVVVVAFTVGASGRVTAHSITRSSGQVTLDRAANQMMAAVSLPPPPNGVFRATVPIRFDIAR